MEVELGTRHRGKLYVLTDNAWEDKGTGLVSVIEGRLIVRDETSEASLYDRSVSASRLQGEGVSKSIVVWEDPELQLDCALSFQDPDSAQQIFAELCGEKAKRALPCPEVENLPELAKSLGFVPPGFREQIAKECLEPHFVAALRQAFHTAEDSGNEQDLVLLWRIAKGVFMLANQALTQRYLRHDMFEDTMGMLEYDEGVSAEKRVCHRQILKVAVRFKQVLAFQDAEMLERIHLNYRLQYLKDHVLARALDDAAFASLSQLVMMNNTILLNHLQKSDALVRQLFDGLRQKDLQSLLFLQDACRLAKTMPPGERKLLYDKMVQHGLFCVLLQFLTEDMPESKSSEGPVPRHLAMEVLVQSTLSDAGHLRRFLLNGEATAEGQDGSELLGNLICLLLADPDHGVQSQVADILQMVMDASQVAAKSRATFLDALYGNGVLDFIAKPLIDIANKTDGNPNLSQSGCYAMQVICELLAFAVANHGRRPEALMKNNSLAYKAVAVAAASPHRYLQLAPLRLVKAMVKAQDHMYLFHMVETGVFGLIFDMVEQSLRPPCLGGGLLASALAELLELIRLQNAKPLVTDLCTKYEGTLRLLAPKVKVAGALLARHECNLQDARQKAKAPLRRASQFIDATADGEVQGMCVQAEKVPEAGDEVKDSSPQDFSQIFGAEVDSDDSSDSDSEEEEEEEQAEEEEEEDSSDDEEADAEVVSVATEATETSASTAQAGTAEEVVPTPTPANEAGARPEVITADLEEGHCPACGSAYTPQALFCSQCGRKRGQEAKPGPKPKACRVRRTFIAASTAARLARANRGASPQKPKEELKTQLGPLSHAPKRARMEPAPTPA